MSSLFPDSLSRPYLPPFRTLLVKGPYHPSAPIHLCFSHTRTQIHSKTVLLTPSRSNFKRSLEEYNDDWLTTNSGLGKIAEISSRIEVLLVFRLSRLFVCQLNRFGNTRSIAILRHLHIWSFSCPRFGPTSLLMARSMTRRQRSRRLLL